MTYLQINIKLISTVTERENKMYFETTFEDQDYREISIAVEFGYYKGYAQTMTDPEEPESIEVGEVVVVMRRK